MIGLVKLNNQTNINRLTLLNQLRDTAYDQWRKSVKALSNSITYMENHTKELDHSEKAIVETSVQRRGNDVSRYRMVYSWIEEQIAKEEGKDKF